MIRKSILLAMIVASAAVGTNTAYAQDQIHYIPPLFSRSNTSGNALPQANGFELVLTTNETTAFAVAVQQGDGTALAGSPFTISANSPQVITLGGGAGPYPAFESGDAALNTILPASGLRLSADQAFFTNIRMINSAQGGSLTGKGRLALGTDFRSGHYKAEGDTGSNDLKSHFISVMATENDTTVNFTEIKAGVVFQGTSTSGVPATSDPISVVLDEGESYIVAYYFPNATSGIDDVNGTRVTSDKPVAMNTGSWLGGAKMDDGGRDVAIDQTVPVDRLGDNFALFVGASPTPLDPGEDAFLERPLVVAVADNTDIFVNGSIVSSNATPLAAGDYHFLTLAEFDINGRMYVELRDAGTGAPQVGYLYQSTNKALNANGPTMGLVPATPCLSASRVEIEDTGHWGNHSIQVVARAGANVTATDSMGPVTLPAPIALTGTSVWDTYTFSVNPGPLSVNADLQFFVTMASELTDRGVQATYSGFSRSPVIISPLPLDSSTISYPVTLSLVETNGPLPGGYQWYLDGVAVAGANGPTLVANGPGVYGVTATTADCGLLDQSQSVVLPSELDIRKEIVATTQVGDSTYQLDYRITVENFTALIMNDVQVTDDLQAALMPLLPATHWSIVSPASTSGDFAAADVNASYDGLTAGDTNLLDTAISLGSRERGFIDYSVQVDIIGGIPAGDNVAVATEGTGTYTATAQEPYPHPNPLSVTVQASPPMLVSPDVYDVTYTVSVENNLDIIAGNLQLIADLQAALGPLPLSMWSIEVAPAVAGGFAGAELNGGFDGEAAGDLALLNGGVDLAPGETGTITFTIRVDIGPAGIPTGALSVLGSADLFPDDLSDDVVGPNHLQTDGPDPDTDPTNDPTSVVFDNDGDGMSDNIDTDDDNDGVPDVMDPDAFDPDVCGDSDMDTCDDCAIGTDDTGPMSDNTPGNDGTDYDADGLCDAGDTDDDNDGVPDGIDPDDNNPDVCGDTDADMCDDCAIGTDGTGPMSDSDPNNDGPDADGNGVCDTFEDRDNDGIIDLIDLDDDNDGIPDTDEAGVDTDGDGIDDAFDLDSDNDGIPDAIEAGHSAADADGDGALDCASGFGTNGLCNDLETAPDSGILDYDADGMGPDIQVDTDGDGQPDFQDLDADNDGVTDLQEGGSGCADTAPADGTCDGLDSDGDGILDALDDSVGFGDSGYPAPTDSDGDGTPDYQSLDADGDGLPDLIEGQSGCTDTTPADDMCDEPDGDGDGLSDGVTGFEAPDSDGDGQDDYQDIDADNDGILDGADGSDDSDGDGLPNYLDLDSDNDGVPDVIEGASGCADIVPAGGDGECDGPDSDGDGRADDATEDSPPDTDGDGAPDFIDLDADNDGIPDVIEGDSGCTDTTPADAVCDGPDNNGDGMPDDGTLGNLPDFDNDGVPDILDLDSDNDGIPDVVEGGSGCADMDENGLCDLPDSDGDGIVDSIDDSGAFGDSTPTVPPDGDNSDGPDYIDLDSDGDGTPDVDGSNCTDTAPMDDQCDGPDSDGDGGVDDIDDYDGFGLGNDTDGDGVANVDDLDDDNDGIPDSEEGDGDTDGDGVPDSLDLDSDNDGIPDVIEAGHSEADASGDGRVDCPVGFGMNGLCDSLETAPDSDMPSYQPVNSDGSGPPDFQDLDSDNDGIPDVIEGASGCTDSAPQNNVCDGPDSDGDGVADSIDNTDGFGHGGYNDPPDSDSDGDDDYRDLDSDGDGIHDIDETPQTDQDGDNDGMIDDQTDSDNDGILDTVDDSDGDGTPDSADDDPSSYGGVTPGADTDNDGTPDTLDDDSDMDGISDQDEAGDDDPSSDPVDTDGDGVPDFQDNDSDNDGIPDGMDNCRLDANPDQTDSNGDGIGDACIDDIDMDGIPDVDDNCPVDPNPDQTDTDEDGLGDACDGDTPRYGVTGGGCSTAAPDTGLLSLLSLFLLLAWRRRRRA